MTREEAKEFIKEQDPGVFLESARKRGYVCPACGNGRGNDGDGIIPRNGFYKCFRCSNVSGDIFDLIGIKYNLSEFKDQFEKAIDIYNISIDKPASTKNKGSLENKANKGTQDNSQNDFTDYFNQCHERVDDTDYFSKRGITKEVIEKFNLGYDPAYKTKDNTGFVTWQAIIIPTSKGSYNARNIHVEPNSAQNGKNKYRKRGSARPFNLAALEEEKEMPIVLCEGEIDAMSIIVSGGQAIGLGSTSSVDIFIRELDRIMPSKPFIIALDNDDPGKEASAKIEEELRKRNITYIFASDIIGEYHDPNERLLKDPEGLRNSIEEAYKKSSELPDPVEAAKEEYIRTSAGYAIGAFREMIKSSESRPRFSTGIKAIDDALDGGIYTGLYIMGAISSLGKTTLSLQIADSLAKQGMDVLFFSLEQSKFELMSKSISRETYYYCKNNRINTIKARSNLDILDGRRWKDFDIRTQEVVNAAFEQYATFAHHVFIYEGIGNISVEEIKEKVKNHISITGNRRPLVFIDYLQILKAAVGDERATDKQIVDHNITALKQLSRDFDIPIIAVSSLNRENYNSKISMAAFKESGAIEYGSDVLIGLQYHGAGETGFDIDEARNKQTREIDFCVLKYRNGKVSYDGIQLDYKPIFNCFENPGNSDIWPKPNSQEDLDDAPEKWI